MIATFEIAVGVAFLLMTVVLVWIVRPGKPFNVWLRKHEFAESMYPLLMMATLIIGITAVSVAFQ